MPRTALTRTAIIDAAFEQLAEGGLASITARALAARLGVQAGALYYHLPDMSTLADEMATRITRQMMGGPDGTRIVNDGMPWPELLRTMAHRIRTTLLDYRDGAKLVSGTRLTDDSVVAATESPLRALTAVGFTPTDALRALQAMNAFVIGWVIEEQHRHPAGDPTDGQPDLAETRRARLDRATHPLNWELSDEFAAMPEEAFDWAVESLVAGIGVRTSIPG